MAASILSMIIDHRSLMSSVPHSFTTAAVGLTLSGRMEHVSAVGADVSGRWTLKLRSLNLILANPSANHPLDRSHLPY